MVKFESSVPMIRVRKETREGLDAMAKGDKRELTDFIRMKLDEIVEDWNKKMVTDGK